MSSRQRIDQLLVDRGLAPTRQKAQAMILAGWVRAAGQRVDKAGTMVAPDCAIDIAEQLRFVGRGGLKLEAALKEFSVDPAGRTCLDVGSSTGGFTDCLLQHGAAKVYAVDSGTNQLDWKLRSDPRVVVRENTNARYLTREDIGGDIASLAVMDVSFISATMIVPAVVPLLEPRSGEMIILVKPQFEVGKGEVGKGGIVRDPALHQAACDRVRQAAEALGFATRLMDSPIPGAEGNREFLLYAQHH